MQDGQFRRLHRFVARRVGGQIESGQGEIRQTQYCCASLPDGAGKRHRHQRKDDTEVTQNKLPERAIYKQVCREESEGHLRSWIAEDSVRLQNCFGR